MPDISLTDDAQSITITPDPARGVVVTTTYRQLANDCAMARSTCISTVKQLCALGLITKHTTEKKNHYTILLHNIKQLCNE